MTAYYNEIEPYAANWLRNLIQQGLLPPGEVDTRSIAEVTSGDLAGFVQCHFFAGLGGWLEALALAGWPWDQPVWTGSCPCQPFSLAGDLRGFADDRHLWPQWLRLIGKCSPPVVFGEQVASATDWLGLVRGDLETLGYAVGAMPIEAASADSYQLRDRFWFVAHDDQQRASQERLQRSGQFSGTGSDSENPVGPLEHAARFGWGERFTEAELRSWRPAASVASVGSRQVIECPDGKWRALPPPGVRWLGNGIPARVAKLRAFGNAIDPRPAAAFIIAASEAIGVLRS